MREIGLSVLGAVMWLVSILAWLQAGTASAQQQFYVSPTGIDSNPGTLTEPWKTLEKARDHVRTINAEMEGDITVHLRGGVYYLKRTLTFTPADSGRNGYRVIYRNYPGETPWISGGVPVTGWTRHRGNIWEAKLDRATKLRQLFVDTSRALTARSSTFVVGQGGAQSTPAFAVAGTEPWAETSGAAKHTGILFKATDVGDYSRPEDIELYAPRAWVAQVLCLSGLAMEGDHRVAMLQEPCSAFSTNIWNVGTRVQGGLFRVWNAFELLDQPGEFYFDRSTRTLFYAAQNGQDPDRSMIVAPILERLISIEGRSTAARVKNLRLEGLVFAHSHFPLIEVAGSRGLSSPQSVAVYTKFRQDMNCHLSEYDMLDIMPAAVEVRNAEAIVLSSNTFQHLGCVGVSLVNDVVDSVVSGSFFYDIGSAAVNTGHPQHRRIGDGGLFSPGVEGVCRNNRVENNVLRETSVECTQAPAITAFYVQGHRIWHNDLLMTPYTGISLGWDWASACKKEGQPGGVYGGWYDWLPGMSDVMRANSISYNRVEFSMTKLSDGAAIYTLGYQDPVTNNKRAPTDTSDWSELRGNWLHYLGHAGFYCDEGSRYWKVVGNAISGGVWILANPGTRDIRVTDGILGNDSGPLKDAARNLTEANNTRINYFDRPSAWPQLARDIYEQSGVEAPYRGMVPARLTRNGRPDSGVTATQSSGDSAGQALDGHVWQHAAARTEAEPNAWWQVDLGEVKEIDYVFLHCSTSTTEARDLKDVWVFVSDTPFTSTDPARTATEEGVWRHFHGGPIWPPASAYRVNWIPVRAHGRYVRIQRSGHGALVLPEVIVFESLAKKAPSRSGGIMSTKNERHYEPTWNSLAQHGAAPRWYEDAVFGIYFHWGIYSVPAFGGEKYPRDMYKPNSAVYRHHRD